MVTKRLWLKPNICSEKEDQNTIEEQSIPLVSVETAVRPLHALVNRTDEIVEPFVIHAATSKTYTLQEHAYYYGKNRIPVAKW